ncbi:MAG: efflux RND transporter periplasmic adaptor subunit [Candidatus Sabulitectum sp.]|nr:efflux RND transporter periplasmic adaptor subunit [Candidatus Sabulitectum sp.]
MKRSVHLIIILAVLLMTGCSEETGNGREDIPVSIYVVKPSMISETINAPCRLESGSEAVISVAVPSIVEEVLVSPGDTVTAGQRLLVLRSDDAQRAMIYDAAAMLTVARASSEYAQENLRRANELLETGAMSAGEYERIQTESRVSMASFNQAAAGYSAASTSARSGLVLAPFNGVVGRVMATEGNRSTGSLMSIFGTEVLRAELLVAPVHIHKLRTGLPAVFTSDHFPGTVFPGAVVSVSETADPLSGLVALTVQFTDDTNNLVPGLSGVTMVSLENREDVLVLPGSMMTLLGEDLMEIFLIEDGRAARRTVETGIRNGISYEITSGLLPGDSVIDLGHTFVSDGVDVRVVQQ